jgi:hypothetical protein
MNRAVPAGSKPQRYTQLLLLDDMPAPAPKIVAPQPHPIVEDLRKLRPDEMTPLQALAKIAALKRSLENNEGAP